MPKPNAIHFEKTYVVRINKARRRWLIAGILSMVVAVPWATYYGTIFYAAKENLELTKTVDEQTGLIEVLQTQMTGFEQMHANADVSLEVNRNSLEQMRKEMVASQAEIEMLREQIQFYQSLMDPDPEKGGVYIETVDIEPAPWGGEYRYRYNIVVAQRSSNHKRVKGEIKVEFIAEPDTEEVRTFALGELTQSGGPLPLDFKFFQQLDGGMTLPDGFNPTRIRVTVQLEGDRSPRLDETHEWKS